MDGRSAIVRTYKLDGFEYDPLFQRIRKTNSDGVVGFNNGWMKPCIVEEMRLGDKPKEIYVRLDGRWFIIPERYLFTGTVNYEECWLINDHGRILPDPDKSFYNAYQKAREKI